MSSTEGVSSAHQLVSRHSLLGLWLLSTLGVQNSRTQTLHLAHNLSLLPPSHRVPCLLLDREENMLGPTQVSTGKKKSFWKVPENTIN